MGGTEKLIEKIVLEAKEEARAILEKAKSEAEEISLNSKKQVAGIMFAGNKKADRLETEIVLKANKDAELLAKKYSLKARHEVLDAALKKAKEQLCAMNNTELSDFLYRVLCSECSQGEGVSPSNAHSAVVKEAVKRYNDNNGNGLKLLEDTDQIEDGFVLVGEGYVKKCCFSQLLADVYEKHLGEIADILF